MQQPIRSGVHRCRQNPISRPLRLLLAVCCLAATATAPGAVQPAPDTSVPAASAARPLRPLTSLVVVGGGPDRPHNQVAIESNVRYVLNLFMGVPLRVALFGDGSPTSRTVAYEAPFPEDDSAETALELALMADDAADSRSLDYRAPQLPQLDGPSTKPAVLNALRSAARLRAPITLYFTGHGSPGDTPSQNSYELWHDHLTAAELAQQLARFSPGTRINLVMAQCFSGGFANDLFVGAQDDGSVVAQDLAGFFGTTQDRVAAGCTPDVHEADYQDFTSYFMAALSGRDRLGNDAQGADYNRDGSVGMDEAFCYALIHDPSIDVPVCTSDAFVRARSNLSDAQVMRTPPDLAWGWATPAQRAALDSLAREAATDPQIRSAPSTGSPVSFPALYHQLLSSFRSAVFVHPKERPYARTAEEYENRRQDIRRLLTNHWRGLVNRSTPDYEANRKAAIEDLRTTHRAEAEALAGSYRELEHITATWFGQEDAEARRLRLLRLFKTVVLTHTILTTGSDLDRRDLRRLLTAERRPLFG